MRAVGLDADIFPRLMQPLNECLVNPERGLSTGEDHHAAGIGGKGLYQLLIAHQRTLLMTGVAEGATEVAAGKANEYGGGSGVEPLTLQAIKNLVNLSHRLLCCLLTPVPPP